MDNLYVWEQMDISVCGNGKQLTVVFPKKQQMIRDIQACIHKVKTVVQFVLTQNTVNPFTPNQQLLGEYCWGLISFVVTDSRSKLQMRAYHISEFIFFPHLS